MTALFARRIAQAAVLSVFLIFLAWPASLRPSELIFRLDVFSNGAAALGARVVFATLFFGLGTLIATWLLGRVFCGWVCPLGTIIDAADTVLNKRPRGRRAFIVKYHVLAIAIGAAALGLSLAWVLAPLGWAARIAAPLAAPRVDWPLFAGLAAALFSLEWVLGKRAFCRVLCPLGATLGLVVHFSLFRRKLSSACTRCGTCSAVCGPLAIGDSPEDYARSECTHCQRCVASCPVDALRFSYLRKPGERQFNLARRELVASLGVGALLSAWWQPRQAKDTNSRPVRPPGAKAGAELASLCIRCGACARVCPTGGIRLAAEPLGVAFAETPVLDGRLGGCAFDCNACGAVCPTTAIAALPLPVKQKTAIGLATIDLRRCVAHAKSRPCLVCYVACPTRAVKVKPSGRRLPWGEELLVPSVDKQACIGCGLCEHRCPVAGDAAIRIAAR